ncbi:MAG TPA: L,D-transpeptidase family protein, partial [Longimicrobiaceae bacterium]|nr:L,D-transpeptidase family protein [Longimicrobiaceae bacterium]
SIPGNPMRLTRLRRILPAALLLLGLCDVAQAAAQSSSGSRTAPSGRRVRSDAISRGRYAVVVDVDASRLYYVRGRQILWSALAGVGTGLRLSSDQDAWDFSTPNGTYHVQHKALEPVWSAPDWYFIENNLPVPPQGDPKRLFPGDLGAAAVYLGDGLAIHGTNHPELLGQRISHGCIRLANADALRLFHEVQPGTEVVIIGGGHVTQQEAAAAAARNRRAAANGRPGPRRDPALVALERLDDDELLRRLDAALEDEADAPADEGDTPGWVMLGAVATQRALAGDDEMVDALLQTASSLRAGPLREEFGAYLADLYTRGALRTLAGLSRLEGRERLAAAQAIVSATIGLYPGASTDRTATWPTNRVPREALDSSAEAGWQALADAEASLRSRLALR